MSLNALLARLEARAVTPVTDAPIPAVTAKPLQTLVCTPVTAVTASASKDQEFFEERAAIAQYCGGLSRADAEAQAAQELQARRDKCKLN